MANLKRHFNFSTKSTINQERELPFSISGKSSYRDFDKNNLMNDIRNCLDVCCCYIQTLNSLCGAGSSLARNLFHAVREVPVYYNVSLQFLSVWEEISKATAGASAAVKTETLMMLQEILNDLEMGKSESDIETTIAESFQVIGTCLCSFIELQAQFSLNTWKSLSKLSKNFTSDSVRHGLQWKSLDRTPSKISVNTDLNSTIKKHFSHIFKVGSMKLNESTDQQFYSPPITGSTNISVYSPFGTQPLTEKPTTNSIWPTPTTIWTSSDSRSIHYSSSNESAEQECINGPPSNIDLDEVINLLSCVPAQQSGNKMNCPNYFSLCSNDEQMYNLLPKVSVPPLTRGLNSHRSWNKEPSKDLFGNDSWIWKLDNMNCSGLPMKEDMLKICSEGNKDVQAHWENKELQKWSNSISENGSSSDDGSSVNGPDNEFHHCGVNGLLSRHLMLSLSNRKQSSGESMPGGLENISESKEECLWATQSKISTWPLKQSTFRSFDSECPERIEHSQFPNRYFATS